MRLEYLRSECLLGAKGAAVGSCGLALSAMAGRLARVPGRSMEGSEVV